MPTYTEFYGLRERPFSLAPDRDPDLTTESQRRAVALLSDALDRGEAVVVVTGAAGVGKTTLVRFLEARLGARRVAVPRLPAATRTAEALLEALGAALGLVQPGGSTPRAIEVALRARAAEGGAHLLVLDEAHRLPSEVLNALRPIVAADGAAGPLAGLLLVGRPELSDRLELPTLGWLRERVVVSHRLLPLEVPEVRPYVEHRLARVGWQEDPRLLPDLFPALRLATGGLPRRINQLMARLLVLAALDQRHELGAGEVVEVADEFDEGPSETPVRLEADRLFAAHSELRPHELAALRHRLDGLDEEYARERRRCVDAEAEVARLRAEAERLALGPVPLGLRKAPAGRGVSVGRPRRGADRA